MRGLEFKRFLFWFGVVPEREDDTVRRKVSTRRPVNNAPRCVYIWKGGRRSLPGLGGSLLLRCVGGGYGGDLLRIG